MVQDNNYLRFFSNRHRAFWALQTTGWVGFAILRLLNGLTHGERLGYLKPTLVAMVTGFVLSLLMRVVYKRIRDRSFFLVAVVSITLSIGLSIPFSYVVTLGHVAFYDSFWNPQGLEYFGNSMFQAYVLMAWSAFYFGLHNSILLQNSREKELRSRAMAQEAQLQMLRYQLNPHFLFNTLNAISTLVMSKESGLANTMLKKLSDFLRHTLAEEPSQKQPLSSELHTLMLYLDIEKVRFEDRLQVNVDVSSKAKNALLPVMLLQPIVENAVKYAVAPSEEGGHISISGVVDGGFLKVVISDDGPGLADKKAALKISKSRTSSGVGVANTKARLIQLYGKNHKFKLKNCEPRGLCVHIELPYESVDRSGRPQR